jgi:hypothetical protein
MCFPDAQKPGKRGILGSVDGKGKTRQSAAKSPSIAQIGGKSACGFASRALPKFESYWEWQEMQQSSAQTLLPNMIGFMEAVV